LATTHTTIYYNIFLHNNGCQFLSIDDIYITNDNTSGQPRISPSEHDMENMVFGALENQSTLPPTRLTMTLCVRIPNMRLTAAYAYNLRRPPRTMKVLHYNATLPTDLLEQATQTQGPRTRPGTYNYYIFRYIGSYQYCFEFSTDSTTNDDTMASLVGIS
jgi:hypothetical protein